MTDMETDDAFEKRIATADDRESPIDEIRNIAAEIGRLSIRQGYTDSTETAR